jgi:hypothetical protein
MVLAMTAAALAKDGTEVYKIEKSRFAVTCKTPAGEPIARYVFATPPKDEPQTSVPVVGYLHPVYTPSGQAVTESRGRSHCRRQPLERRTDGPSVGAHSGRSFSRQRR